MERKPNSRTIGRAVAFAVTALLAACASEMPTGQIAVADSAIEHAERDGAAQYAAASLATARDKLQRARNGADSHDLSPEEVSRLAQEAEADARLAQAQTQLGKAQAAVAATEADLRALREEADRAASAPVVP